MKTLNSLRTLIAIVLCATMALPHSAFGGQRATKTIDGIRISHTIKNVELGEAGIVKGVIVDQSGSPVAGAPLIVGKQGKLIAKMKTDQSGRFNVTGLDTGMYQLVSFAGVEAFQAVPAGTPDSVKGIVQVIDDEGIARGQLEQSWIEILLAILQNPILWGLIIAAAVAIPLALDDDDAS